MVPVAYELLIISEPLQEAKQAVRRLVPDLLGSGRLDNLQRRFFHLEVSFYVNMSRGRALVAEPQRYERDIHAGLEQMHGGGVPEGVRRDATLAETGAFAGSVVNGTPQSVGDSRARERSAGFCRK